jgi:hypothetical protein
MRCFGRRAGGVAAEALFELANTRLQSISRIGMLVRKSKYSAPDVL